MNAVFPISADRIFRVGFRPDRSSGIYLAGVAAHVDSDGDAGLVLEGGIQKPEEQVPEQQALGSVNPDVHCRVCSISA